jgi:hypothetical protein
MREEDEVPFRSGSANETVLGRRPEEAFPRGHNGHLMRWVVSASTVFPCLALQPFVGDACWWSRRERISLEDTRAYSGRLCRRHEAAPSSKRRFVPARRYALSSTAAGSGTSIRCERIA